MKSLIFFALLQVALVVSQSTCPNQDCGPNASFRTCTSICGDGCLNFFEPRPCPAVCGRPGCVCNQDFYRQPDGRCELPSNCPLPSVWNYTTNEPITPRCPCCSDDLTEFKLYNKCVERCPDPNIKVKCGTGPEFDEENCFCKLGFCRDSCGKCVPDPRGDTPVYIPNTSPSCCAKEDELVTTSNSCFELCPRPDIIIDCIAEVEKGCFCRKGYCRDMETKECRPGEKNIEFTPSE